MTTEPKLLTEADLYRFREMSQEAVTAELRERGLIADEPVDPLLVEARGIVRAVGLSLTGPGDGAERCDMAASGDCDDFYENKIALAALRRGMELAPRKELTRQKVREMVKAALRDSAAVLEYDDFLLGSPVGPAREADDFVTRLHAAIQEALQ